MPHKFNDARRGKFEKARYRVANPSEYNESLRQRGDLTVWVSDDVAEFWASPRRKTRGGQARYSDLAIEICLTLRVVFRLPLRQTQGFMRSIVKLMGLDLVVQDYSTISRRGKHLKIVQGRRDSDEPITLIVDSTGLKIHGGNIWHEEKHGTRKVRKTWRNRYIAFDPETGEFGPEIEIIIPPPKNAVHGANAQRNQHIDAIAEHGRMKWQTEAGYNERSQVEAQIGRWKQVVGDRLQARDFDNQTVEAEIASKALNRMTALGRAAYERVF